MQNILITAPSLKENINISGISTYTKSLIQNNSADYAYFHFQLGKKDSEKKRVKWLFNQLLLLPRFITSIIKNKIEIVHLNSDLTPLSLLRDFYLLSVINFLFKKKILLHIHGGHFLMAPPRKRSIFYFLISSMLKQVDTRVVLSEIEKNNIEKTYGYKCVVMPNAIKPYSAAVQKDFHGKLSLFFMGRIVKSKGIFLLANCLDKLSSSFDDFDLNIYGTGPDLDDFLFKLSNIKGLSYKYHGVIQGAEKNNVIDASHVFLLPSLFGEGLPIALLESMSGGCIPVVSDDASIGSVVIDGYNGYLIPKGSESSLEEKLNKLLTDRQQLIKMSRNAKDTIDQSYNLKDYILNLNKLYRGLSYGTN